MDAATLTENHVNHQQETPDDDIFSKSKIQGFLDRYYLDGEIERTRVEYSPNSQTLRTAFRSTDESVTGVVTLKEFDFDREFDIAIHDTTRLRKLIGVLEDQIDINLEWVHEPVSIYFVDDFKKVRFILGQKAAIPKVNGTPNVDIDWNIEFDLKPMFIKNFKSAVKALENGSFAVDVSDDGRMKLVLGYMTRGSNNSINLYPDPDVFKFSPKPNKPLVFNATKCTKMLSANADSTNSRCKISSTMDVMKFEFESDTFESTYYISAINPGNM